MLVNDIRGVDEQPPLLALVGHLPFERRRILEPSVTLGLRAVILPSARRRARVDVLEPDVAVLVDGAVPAVAGLAQPRDLLALDGKRAVEDEVEVEVLLDVGRRPEGRRPGRGGQEADQARKDDEGGEDQPRAAGLGLSRWEEVDQDVAATTEPERQARRGGTVSPAVAITKQAPHADGKQEARTLDRLPYPPTSTSSSSASSNACWWL